MPASKAVLIHTEKAPQAHELGLGPVYCYCSKLFPPPHTQIPLPVPTFAVPVPVPTKAVPLKLAIPIQFPFTYTHTPYLSSPCSCSLL
jgi:hypothetical protein